MVVLYKHEPPTLCLTDLQLRAPIRVDSTPFTFNKTKRGLRMFSFFLKRESNASIKPLALFFLDHGGCEIKTVLSSSCICHTLFLWQLYTGEGIEIHFTENLSSRHPYCRHKVFDRELKGCEDNSNKNPTELHSFFV